MVTQSDVQAWTKGLNRFLGADCVAVWASRAHDAPISTGDQRIQPKSRL
jgi:hypothetical protein